MGKAYSTYGIESYVGQTPAPKKVKFWDGYKLFQTHKLRVWVDEDGANVRGADKGFDVWPATLANGVKEITRLQYLGNGSYLVHYLTKHGKLVHRTVNYKNGELQIVHTINED